jgi:5-methylcytosine-specific restriction protein A
VKVCAEPGCPNLTEGTRCENCRKAKRRREDRKRPSAAKRGYDKQWSITRREYLKRYPWCEEAGCNETATDVDHIDGLGPNGPQGHDWSNLRSYCHRHHSQRTAKDQPGGFHAIQGR